MPGHGAMQASIAVRIIRTGDVRSHATAPTRAKTPRGTRIARWYCPQSHTTFSLLPDCLAARLAHYALTAAALGNARTVTAEHIEHAVAELRL